MKVKMVFKQSKKLKETQNGKFWLYTFSLCLFINCIQIPEGRADIQADYLDPLEILISSIPENTNEPNITQQEMRITHIQPAPSKSQSVLPLDFSVPLHQNLVQNSLSISEEPKSDAANQLLEASISILSNDKNSKIKSELQNLIEKINSIQLKTENLEPQTGVTNETQAPEKNVIQTNTEKQEQLEQSQTTQAETELKLPYTPIAEQTLQALDKLAQQPETADHPFELAEVLFLSNHFEKAAIFYAEALNRTSSLSSISAQKKAWILFQMGNCLRKKEPDKAKQAYTQLINEFPESSWTGPAKSQVELIDWYQKDKPEKIIAEQKS
jgi:tetratricopeptide (TPR) repeat protein